jgi:hypothetical protein
MRQDMRKKINNYYTIENAPCYILLRYINEVRFPYDDGSDGGGGNGNDPTAMMGAMSGMFGRCEDFDYCVTKRFNP